MMTKILVGILLIPLSYALYASNDTFPLYSAARVSDPPVIDGALEEDCWKNAEVTAPFVAIGGKVVNVRTTGMVGWDDKTLYLALVCEEPKMAVIEERIRSGQISGSDQSIEVFIDSNYDRSSYIHSTVKSSQGVASH